jgi:hypothetical protein
MKTICAWCGKVIKDGPEKTVSHGVCEDCVIRVTEPKQEEDRQPPTDFCERVAWWVECLFMGSILFNLVFWILVLVVKALHHFGSTLWKSFTF